MNLAMVQNQASSSGAALNKILIECSSITADVSDEIRTLSYMMHPPLLDEMWFRDIHSDVYEGDQPTRGP
jgi:hypothetical protein